jgi:lambda family phage portal protein
MSRYSRAIQNPTLAEAYEHLRAEYNAARTSRFRRARTGVGPAGRSGDYHYRTEGDYLRMMELSRDFMRNDPIVPQGVHRLLANVLRDGFALDPQTDDAGLDRAIWDRWDAWTRDPNQTDLAGEHDWHEIEGLVLQQVIVDGDICELPLREGCLESVEAHRLRTPSNTTQNVVHGVLLDANRRRLEYWFTRDDVDPGAPVAKVGDMKRYAARDADGRRQVFHCYLPDRVSQTRGVTAFAPIVDMVGFHDDIQFAKLVQAQVASCFAVFRERSPMATYQADPQRGERTGESLGDGSTRIIEGIAPGMEITGQPGEKLQGFSPNVPNAEFFPHATLILTFIAINLGLPLAVLLLDPSQTNFSGWRGAMDQARIGFRRLQRRLAARLHEPVYAWKLRQFAAEDPALRTRLDDPKLFAHRFCFPRWPYIQPMEDAAADLIRQRNLLASPRMVAAERGYDWDDVVQETVSDNAQAILAAKKKAVEINAAQPDDSPVQWREVLALPTPDRIAASFQFPLAAPGAQTPPQ